MSIPSQLPTILCFGAMHMDKLARCYHPFVEGTSNPVSSEVFVGGVAFNIARHLKSRQCEAGMVSCVGDDPSGRHLLAHAAEWQIGCEFVHISEKMPSANYTALLNPDGELVAGLSDVAIYDQMTVEQLAPHLEAFKQWSYWVLDANLPARTLHWLCQNKGNTQVLAAPVSVSKAKCWQQILEFTDFWIGNAKEASVLCGFQVEDAPSAYEAAEKLRKLGTKTALITLGAKGIVVSSVPVGGHWQTPPAQVQNVNGAGDAFFAGFISTFAKGASIKNSLELGLALASLTTEHQGTVALQLDEQRLLHRLKQIPPPQIFYQSS